MTSDADDDPRERARRNALALALTRRELVDGSAGEEADLVLAASGELALVPLPAVARADVDAAALAYRQATVFALAAVIVQIQRGHLLGDEPRRDLILRDLAEPLDLHESTCSRGITGKLLDAPRGRIELKSLIGIAPTPSATDAVKQWIAAFIAAEDPRAPLTDDQLRQRLETEHETVASTETIRKLRERAGFPPPSRRRRR